MDFGKTGISKNVGKFLEENLKTEKDKESLINLTSGKSVLKGDAINLLLSVLNALTIVDNLDDEEYNASAIVTSNDVSESDPADDAGSKVAHPSEFPSLAQSMAEWNKEDRKGKKELNNKLQEPSQGTSRNAQQLTGDELLHKFQNVCYFYKIGKCRFGKECKKEHPKFCQKFLNFGPIKSNTRGCDSKCNNLHPIACRDSIKISTSCFSICQGQPYTLNAYLSCHNTAS